MPIYTYRCNQCHFVDEVMQVIKKRDETYLCPQDSCTGIMCRDVDVPSFHLKGGGWYKDGYSSTKTNPKEEEK